MVVASRFAIRVGGSDELFAPLQARPVAERSLDETVRLYLLDEWERVRKTRPVTLTVYAPATDRPRTDEQAVGTAVRADLRAHTGRLRQASPLTRQAKIAAWTGLIVFLISIVISTSLDQLSSDPLVAGVSQGIVVVGWVALWGPAQTVAVDILPHHFARKRYAELAEVELRFAWQDDPGQPAASSVERLHHSPGL